MGNVIALVGVILFVGGIILFVRKKNINRIEKHEIENPPFQVVFKKNVPNKQDLGEPTLVLKTNSSNIIMGLFYLIIFIAIYYFLGVHFSLIFPLIFGIVFFISIFDHIIVYENAISIITLFQKKVYYFNEISSIVGKYEISLDKMDVSNYNKVVIESYWIMKDEKIEAKIISNNYKNSFNFQDAFQASNPYIEKLIQQ